MPVWCTRRHVQARDVVFLVAGVALLAILAMAVWPTLHILNMRNAVITLARKISGRMAVETSRMFEDGDD